MIEDEDSDIAELFRCAMECLMRQGIPDADQVAQQLMTDIRRELGGGSMYVKRGVAERNLRIRMEYSGKNIAKLAAQYGLSRRRIEQIINTG
jgi:Mor family transcriptional regulator